MKLDIQFFLNHALVIKSSEILPQREYWEA